MNTTTIPKQHYITIQYRKDASIESGHLGFLSPYTKDAAFRKRKETQDRWAYGYGTTVTIDENDDITVTGGGKQGGYGHMDVDASTLFMTNCYPIIINNELTEGFQISKSVRRSGSWGGGGNVLWRIADPRGFELEISSSNFAAMLNCVTIENGVIKEKCLWGRNGKDNILLPESSDIYQSAEKLTKKISENILLKDVKVGDTVDLLIKNNRKEENIYQYFGKYFFLVAEQQEDNVLSGRRYYGGNGHFIFNQKQVERYLMKDVKSGKYEVFSTPKVLSIVNSIEIPMDKMEIAKEVTAWFSRENYISDISNLILVSPTKIKLDSVTTELIQFDEVIDTSWPLSDFHHPDAIVNDFDDKFWLSGNENSGYDSVGNRIKTPQLRQIELNITNNELTVKRMEISNSGRSWVSHYTNITRKDFTFDQLKMYRLQVTANGIKGKVYRLQ